MTTGPDSRPDSRPVRTVFLGSGGFGIESLRCLSEAADVDLVGIVTAPARPAGRKQQLTATPIQDVAEGLGVPAILTPSRLRSPESVAAVLDLQPALLVLADYGQIVPGSLLGLRHGALNLHPSLLPRHRGATPIPAAILAGDAETGVTLMRMDAGLDTGPVVAQVREALDGTETAPTLEARLAISAGALLAASLGGWLRDEIEPSPQPTDGASLTRPLRRDDGRLDPAMSAVTLERQVRAYVPWPGSFVDAEPSGRLIVETATVRPDEPADVAGRLVAHGDGLAMATADGRLVLTRGRPAGRRSMTAAELRRGAPGLVGSLVR